MKDRARHVRLANYRERLGGACVRRMNYQRQIERDCNAREAGEHHLRGVEHGRVPGALAVPRQSDFADRANRIALPHEHLEHRARVIFAMFKIVRDEILMPEK